MEDNSMDCGLTISNMSHELFNDALYYKEQSESFTDFFIQWRYKRSAIISFCASAEAWMSSLIKCNLKDKTISSREQEVLDFINDHNANMPIGYSNVRRKLYNFIPAAITGSTINWANNPNEIFERYIVLSNMRNNIVHYATRNGSVIRSDEFSDLLDQAAQIIEDLFNEYDILGSKVNTPSWFKERNSKEI